MNKNAPKGIHKEFIRIYCQNLRITFRMEHRFKRVKDWRCKLSIKLNDEGFSQDPLWTNCINFWQHHTFLCLFIVANSKSNHSSMRIIFFLSKEFMSGLGFIFDALDAIQDNICQFDNSANMKCYHYSALLCVFSYVLSNQVSFT